MNIADIVKEIKNLYPKLKNAEAQKIVYNLFWFIGNQLSKGKRIEVRVFGAFSLKKEVLEC